MIVVYSNLVEVIVCDINDEKKVIKEWFDEGGRDFDDYDRDLYSEPFAIGSRIKFV